MDWQSTQSAIQDCRRCEKEVVPCLIVPPDKKRAPPWEPLTPVRLYFVSVAPPFGGAYFWDERQRDAVRARLFMALHEALGLKITTCEEFRNRQFFLTPMVKCPSMKANRDHPSHPTAITNCGPLLRDELLAARPERILALGRVPFIGICKVFGVDAPKTVAQFRKRVSWIRLGDLDAPMLGTYFVGNNRHKGFPSIVEDINRLLELKPRTVNG